MKQSILIIDDNKDILEFLTVILEEQYTLHLALNGELAQEILDREIIHLIISDIMMPGIDGFQLCKLIKSNIEYCHIPVILLTSKNTHSAHIEGLEVGADAYIQKPFSDELLQMQISNLLRNRQKIKEHFSSSPFEDVRVMAHSKTDEAFLNKLDQYIKDNLQNSNFDVDALAEHVYMSRTTFYRKLKSLSELSPKELIDITRLKTAARMIAENNFALSEIAKKVGYTSQSVFNRNFQKYFKMTPTAYYNSLPRA